MPELSIEESCSMRSHFVPHIESNLTTTVMDLRFYPWEL